MERVDRVGEQHPKQKQKQEEEEEEMLKEQHGGTVGTLQGAEARCNVIKQFKIITTIRSLTQLFEQQHLSEAVTKRGDALFLSHTVLRSACF